MARLQPALLAVLGGLRATHPASDQHSPDAEEDKREREAPAPTRSPNALALVSREHNRLQFDGLWR
jgi:hypothetical protein